MRTTINLVTYDIRTAADYRDLLAAMGCFGHATVDLMYGGKRAETVSLATVAKRAAL